MRTMGPSLDVIPGNSSIGAMLAIDVHVRMAIIQESVERTWSNWYQIWISYIVELADFN